MDRTVATQIIALLIVLAALLRWVPDEDPRDALGLGDPKVAWDIDRSLSQLGDDERRAYLRSIRSPDRSFYSYWLKKLQRVRYLHNAAPPDTVVQLKGFGRNLLWPVIYDLYPLTVAEGTRTYEEGSRVEDPDLPGAEVMKSGIVPYEDMTEEQLRTVKQKRRQGNLRGQPKVDPEEDG